MFVSNEDVPTTITCTYATCFEALGVSQDHTYTIRDLWLHEEVGELSANEFFNFTVTDLPIHGGVAAYRFTKAAAAAAAMPTPTH